MGRLKAKFKLINKAELKGQVKSNIFGTYTLIQRRDGLVYFKGLEHISYGISYMEWDGPEYATRTETTTAKTKGKDNWVGNAALGYMLGGSSGAMIGAGMSKPKAIITKNTQQYTEETYSSAVIKLVNQASEEEIRLDIYVLSAQAVRLAEMAYTREAMLMDKIF